MITPTLYTSPGTDLYKSCCLQVEALWVQVTPEEIFLKMVGAQQCQHQREVDLKFIEVEDLLVGDEGD